MPRIQILAFPLLFLFPVFCLSAPAPAAPSESLFSKWKAGIHGGGQLDFVFSDSASGISAAGLGSQFGMTLISRHDKPFGLKMRIERVMLNETSLRSTDTSDIIPNTQLKSLEQNWWLFGAGCEWRTDGPSHQAFWELNLGYAYGTSGRATFENPAADQRFQGLDLAVRSGPFLGAGGGMRRRLVRNIEWSISVTTFYLIGSIYTEGLDSRNLVPLPLKLSFGLEMPL